jgi:uncharacterized protein with GYD domain
MAIYFMLGKYSESAVKEISSDRTEKTVGLIQELGGKIRSMYALLGEHDVVLIVELPTLETAMKASLGITLLTGLSFKTYPALAVDDFDRVIGEL